MLTPTLTAMMCDGMGSFSDVEYKRMLLAFDRIYYLVPQQLVEFQDITGRPSYLLFPERIRTEATAFVPCDYAMDEPYRRALVLATEADLSVDALRAAAATIPHDELLYTWRVVNADGALAEGRSIGLAPSQAAYAQLLLLNKFLLAADAHGSIPITGKAYVHRLLALKYQHAEQTIGAHLPDLLPPRPRGGDLRHGPFVARLVSEFISDAELEARSLAEIVEYKQRHATLFEEFSLSVRTLVSAIQSLPADAAFHRDVSDVLGTKVWRVQRDIEREMRSAWDALFLGGVKTMIKSDAAKNAAKAVGSALALGVMPHIVPGALTWASALAVGGAVAPWVLAELVGALGKQREARRNGLYYLIGFTA